MILAGRGVQWNSSGAVEARGDFLRFRSARSRPGAPAGSGFMILLPKSFQILAAGSKAYRFIENLLDFLDFLLNSSIFHDYSLRSRGGVSKNAPFSKVGHQLDRSRKYSFSPKDGASRRVLKNQIANERRTYNIYRVATLFWRGTEGRDEGKRHFGENILIDLVSISDTKT